MTCCRVTERPRKCHTQLETPQEALYIVCTLSIMVMAVAIPPSVAAALSQVSPLPETAQPESPPAHAHVSPMPAHIHVHVLISKDVNWLFEGNVTCCYAHSFLPLPYP